MTRLTTHPHIMVIQHPNLPPLDLFFESRMSAKSRALYGTPAKGTRNDHLTDANDAEIVHACFVLDAAYEEAGRQLLLKLTRAGLLAVLIE